MPSNRQVTYIDIRLNSIEEYWDNLVVPNVKEFRTSPSSRSLFNAAGSMWHLHDWVWHDRNPGQDSRGASFDTYRNDLLNRCPELGWLRDIADAAKHRGLGRLPRVQEAEPQVISGVYRGLLALGTDEYLEFFLVLNDGSKHAMRTVLNTAVEFWRTELAGRPLASP
jgi:hypothetical protein